MWSVVTMTYIGILSETSEIDKGMQDSSRNMIVPGWRME